MQLTASAHRSLNRLRRHRLRLIRSAHLLQHVLAKTLLARSSSGAHRLILRLGLVSAKRKRVFLKRQGMMVDRIGFYIR